MEGWSETLQLLKGLGLTLGLALMVIPLGLGLGTLLAVLRVQNPLGLGRLAVVYIELFRSVPLILFLFFTHYGVFPALGMRPDILMSCVVTFCVFEAAYFAEILRGGILAIRPTEKDAAIALGLSGFHQWTLVYLPLAYQRSLPALVNQLVTLIKDTSLASIVGVVEFTRAGEIIYERTYQVLGILLLQAAVYFVVCYGLSRWAGKMESARGPHEPAVYSG